MNRRKRYLVTGMTVLILGLTAAGAVKAAEHNSTQANWDNLKRLAAGDEVRVVLKDGKSYPGKFRSFRDEGIVVRAIDGEQTFPRQDVLRVSAEKESHRKRNVLIGVAVGCGGGVGIAAGYASSQRKEYPLNHYFEVDGPILGILFGGAGGGLAAAFSRCGWHDVYRAQ